MTRAVMLCGWVGAAALAGCGDSSGGGADGDTQVADAGDAQGADGGDAAQSDVYVPGPGECELNWVSGFSPAIRVQPETWVWLDPHEVGKVHFAYAFVDGPSTSANVNIQICRLVGDSLQFRASSGFNEVNYSLAIDVPNFLGPGVWMVGVDDGLSVRFDLSDASGPGSYHSQSGASGMCEICIDATGRQGAFRCDELADEAQGLRGGIDYAGFICPNDEAGFIP